MTGQIHETFVLDGEEWSLACEPTIPVHPRIAKVRPEEVDASYPFLFATFCWRNYVGSWKMEDGRLYLTGITGIYKLIGDEPLFADWYCGTLRVPVGDVIECVHMGYGTTYDRELFIEVKDGVAVHRRIQTRTPIIHKAHPILRHWRRFWKLFLCNLVL